jgi:hypothetical protein
MERSHSRHSFPADKMLPKNPLEKTPADQVEDFTLSTEARGVLKKLHTRKNRQRSAAMVRMALTEAA